MTTADLAYGRRVIWRGLAAEIVDIHYRATGIAVRIRVIGGHQHWTTAAELSAVGDRPQETGDRSQAGPCGLEGKQ